MTIIQKNVPRRKSGGAHFSLSKIFHLNIAPDCIHFFISPSATLSFSGRCPETRYKEAPP